MIIAVIVIIIIFASWWSSSSSPGIGVRATIHGVTPAGRMASRRHRFHWNQILHQRREGRCVPGIDVRRTKNWNKKKVLLYLQAARILLPGADFPPRGVAFNFEFSTVPGPGLDELDFVTTVGLWDNNDNEADGNHDDNDDEFIEVHWMNMLTMTMTIRMRKPRWSETQLCKCCSRAEKTSCHMLFSSSLLQRWWWWWWFSQEWWWWWWLWQWQRIMMMMMSIQVNTATPAGLTPLMLACLREDVAVVSFITNHHHSRRHRRRRRHHNFHLDHC